jgi:hypothetical protein
MGKRQKPKSPARYFEEHPLANSGERMFVHYPGEMNDVTLFSDRYTVIPDYNKIRKLMEKHGERKYGDVHQHIYSEKDKLRGKSSMPTDEDISGFLVNDDVQSTIVNQFNPQEEKTEGYYVLKKTARTPKSGVGFSKLLAGKNEKEMNEVFEKSIKSAWSPFAEAVHKYKMNVYGRMESKTNNHEERQQAIEELARAMHLQVKYVPAEGYQYLPGKCFEKKEEIERERKEKHQGELENKIVVGVLGSLGIFLFGYLFSYNITGFAISNVTREGSYGAIIFALLAVIGIIFLSFRNRKF